MDTKAFKRSLHHSDKYYRKGFGREKEITQLLRSEYHSTLIQQIQDNDYKLQWGKVTIRLAQAFGFCWGVERSVAMAYETRQQFPDKRIWITNEIIHNPLVNQNLRNMQVEFIPLRYSLKDFSVVAAGDIVILPAFGASIQEIQLLN
jgi:4-hydroxy-3-methylbut-2-enyl diphosphate reductase